jgi:hypothetical protein
MTWLLSLRYVFLVLLAAVTAAVVWSALTERDLD